VKNICLFTNGYYKKNECFNLTSVRNRDNIFLFNKILKERLAELGFNLATEDINSIESSHLVFFYDKPDFFLSHELRSKSILFLFESEIILKNNYADLDGFKMIYTWKKKVNTDAYVFQHLLPYTFPNHIEYNANKGKNIVMICGNKSSINPFEIYSQRKLIINYFENRNAQNFDLYGTDWDVLSHANKYFNYFLKKLSPLYSKFIVPNCYKGYCHSKFDVLKNYNFSFSFENCIGVENYISEKIFDSFVANCIPIYFNDSNLKGLIPNNLYINYSEFENLEQLDNYISNISDSKIRKIKSEIFDWLNSEEINKFSTNSFLEKFISHFLEIQNI
jgi:hypothetical protein